MLHPLEQKIVALRRRVRRLAAVYGLSIVAAILLATVAVLGETDCLLRLEDRGVRIIVSLAALVVLAWSCRRFLAPNLFARLTDADLVLRVQRAFPRLKDGLLSAVEFLGQSEDDPTAGSAALRRAVIAQAAAETQDLNFFAVLDRRPATRAALLLIAACFLASIIVLLAPADARVAVARLLNPLGNTAWPRATHLKIARPVERIARGQPFEIMVVDAFGARLPPEVRIQYRDETPDGGVVEESERMRFADGAMAARRENVQRTFSYRVEGGDDRSMPWSKVEVVEPPAIESLSIRLVPPAYTGWPAVPSERDIRALAGTEVRITGQATRPLAAADLRLDGGRKIPAEISDDGRWFTIGYGGAALAIEKSAAYWFELTDREGLRGGADDRGQITAIPDAPPMVHIERPTANLFVIPQAVVPIRVAANDDIAIRDLSLMFRRGDSEPERAEPFFSGPKQPPSQPGPNPAGDSRVVDYRWDLAPLNLKPGTQLTFYAAAGDYLPQTGKSDPRRLSIVTLDELQQRIAAREKLIAAELQRALKMQRTCRSQVESLAIRLTELRRFERIDVDHLQAAELGQREVGRLLTSRSEGVLMHVLGLLADLENNRLDGADARRQMTSLLTELDQLNREHLPPMDHQLTAAVKTTQLDREGQGGAAGAGPSVADCLTVVGRHQDVVIAALEQLLGQLARWDSYRRFCRDIGQVLHDQEDLAGDTSEVGRRTVARELRDLAPQDAADLKIAAGRQLELARLLDRLLQEMDQAGAQLRQSDPLAADLVADALGAARRLAIAAEMRNAGDRIRQNQIGQATAGQEQIARSLQEVLDVLANRSQQEVVRLVKKLRELQSDLAAVEASQEALRKEIAAAAKNQDRDVRRRELDRLAAGQRELRDETQRLAWQLERLQAAAAAQAAALAAGQMDQCQGRAGQGDCAGAAGHAAEAQQSLAEARRQLDEALHQAAAELAVEQVARLEDNVKHLRRQQQGALEEARRLRRLEESQGQLSRAQALAAIDLARLQHSLQADAARLGKQLTAAGPFALVLDGAAADMGRAADSLDRRDTGSATQDAQRGAIRRLDLLLEALKPEPPAAQSGNAGGGNQGGKSGPPGDRIQNVAQLKLLKFLQQEINVRTEQLQQAISAAGKPTEEQLREGVELSRQQGRLADVALESLQPVRPNPVPEPDAQRSPQAPRAEPGTRSVPITVGDEEQLKRELGAAAVKEDDPVLDIVRQMRDTASRIGQADAGAATQLIQRQIVADLDRLIEQARKKAGQCSPSACQPPPGASRSSVSPPGSKPSSAGQKPGNRPAASSSKRPPGDGRTTKADAAGTRALIKRLWGMLPQHAREQMLQLPAEDFLPKYELQIEDYFRRLAEEGQER